MHEPAAVRGTFAVRDELGNLRDYQLLWRAFMVWLVAEPGRPVIVGLPSLYPLPLVTARPDRLRGRAGRYGPPKRDLAQEYLHCALRWSCQ
jgi:hypothetical protein